METLKASVQYGDWEGTAAADDLDKGDLKDWLATRGLMDPDSEMVIGVDFFCGENHPGHIERPSIHAIVAQVRGNENLAARLRTTPDPLPLRRVQIELTIEAFVGLFKRFSVVLTSPGLGVTGRTYRPDD